MIEDGLFWIWTTWVAALMVQIGRLPLPQDYKGSSPP